MDSDTAFRGSGAAAVLVTMAAILLATLVSPAFAWTGNALSDLGVTGTAAGTGTTVLLFNGGLIAGGVLGLVFAVALARTRPTLAGSVVGGLFALTMALMGLVGVFPEDTDLHFPVAVGFYLLLSLSLWVDGALSFREGWRSRAVAGLGLGAVNLLGWLVWGVTGSVRRPGLAVPEIVGALALSAWAVWLSAGLVRGRWASNA